MATVLTTSEADLAGSIVTFQVPEDRDVWVVAWVPDVAAPRRGRALVLLTDGEDRVIDRAEVRSVRRASADVILHELVPAGSGTVTRKVRGRTTRRRGAANQDGTGLVTIEALVR